MDITWNRKDLLFLLVCLGLGFIADQTLFHGSIGIGYLVFLVGFYLVFFIRFRKITFGQRRMGMLIMLVIWSLASHYFLYDVVWFTTLNYLIIPVLVLAHIVLITKPSNIRWYRPAFLLRMIHTFGEAFPYNTAFVKKFYQRVFKNIDPDTTDVVKKVLLGLVIGGPLLCIILALLMSADQAFQELLWKVPSWLLSFQVEDLVLRAFIIFVFGFLMFGIFQVLPRKRDINEVDKQQDRKQFDGIVSLTILILLNFVYLLFTIVQFTYFFGGDLVGNMTYAEYARRGFFELLMVTLLNWTVLSIMLIWNNPNRPFVDRTMKVMYSLLIGFSGVLLLSGFQRLSLYEAHYGYTMDRVLPHVFMIYLFIIFTYTLVKVWFEKLSLIHFYIITGLLFYAALNIVNVEQWIVDKNLERYEDSGKIDVMYLNSLTYTGVNGLLDLYERDPDYPKVERILLNRKQQWLSHNASVYDSWRSFNVMGLKVKERLRNWQPE